MNLNVKNFIKKLVLGYRCDSDSYLNHLRKAGSRIGERVVVYEPSKTFIDETRPFLIEIGNDVQITRGVTMLTHGYDWSVLKGIHAEVLGSAGRIKVGNNVFIGQNTMILKGVTIGNNVVIGANSLVNKDIPDNCVYAGNPARYITSIDEYYKKRKAAQLSEAKCIYDNYVKSYGKDPGPEIFGEFFWLFQERDEALLPEFTRRMKTLGNYNESMANFKSSIPEFNGYEDFLDALKKTDI